MIDKYEGKEVIIRQTSYVFGVTSFEMSNENEYESGK